MSQFMNSHPYLFFFVCIFVLMIIGDAITSVCKAIVATKQIELTKKNAEILGGNGGNE